MRLGLEWGAGELRERLQLAAAFLLWEWRKGMVASLLDAPAWVEGTLTSAWEALESEWKALWRGAQVSAAGAVSRPDAASKESSAFLLELSETVGASPRRSAVLAVAP